MFIKDGIYRSIKPQVALPITAGTVLTINGLAATAATAYGIVPETINVLPPTGRIYVAIGGTIDLADPANAGITIDVAVQQALSGINFVPEPPIQLPAVTGGDNGKILRVSNGKWTTSAAELPSVSNTDIGKVLKATENGAEWAEAGGGGGGGIVNLVYDENTRKINASYNDLNGYLQDGKIVQYLIPDGTSAKKRCVLYQILIDEYYYAEFLTRSSLMVFVSQTATDNLVYDG